MSFRFSTVEPLSPTEVLTGFDCGSAAQSDWLVEHALQAHRAGLSRVYVVRGTDEEQDRVVGYYALAAGSVAPHPSMDRHHQPVVILTRLGVDRSVQGVGVGRALVADALRRIAGAADVIGVRAVLIHCESEQARDFYLRLAKFEASPTDPMHLLLLVKDLRRALDRRGETALRTKEMGDRRVAQLIRDGVLTPARNTGGLAALLAIQPVDDDEDGDAGRAVPDLREDRL